MKIEASIYVCDSPSFLVGTPHRVRRIHRMYAIYRNIFFLFFLPLSTSDDISLLQCFQVKVSRKTHRRRVNGRSKILVTWRVAKSCAELNRIRRVVSQEHVICDTFVPRLRVEAQNLEVAVYTPQVVASAVRSKGRRVHTQTPLRIWSRKGGASKPLR